MSFVASPLAFRNPLLAQPPREIWSAAGCSSGRAQARIAKAAGVARLDSETAVARRRCRADLDQAAAVASYAEDPNTNAVLIDDAAQATGRFLPPQRGRSAGDAASFGTVG